MKAPITQEEIDYRADLSNKVNAISSIQGLFTDIEDKPRRLRILKALLTNLNYGDALNAEIDAEIAALEEAAAQTEAENEVDDTSDVDNSTTEDAGTEDADMDLGSLEALEDFTNKGSTKLFEDQNTLEDFNVTLLEDDLPAPDELDDTKDFSENN